MAAWNIKISCPLLPTLMCYGQYHNGVYEIEMRYEYSVLLRDVDLPFQEEQ